MTNHGLLGTPDGRALDAWISAWTTSANAGMQLASAWMGGAQPQRTAGWPGWPVNNAAGLFGSSNPFTPKPQWPAFGTWPSQTSWSPLALPMASWPSASIPAGWSAFSNPWAPLTALSGLGAFGWPPAVSAVFGSALPSASPWWLAGFASPAKPTLPWSWAIAPTKPEWPPSNPWMAFLDAALPRGHEVRNDRARNNLWSQPASTAALPLIQNFANLWNCTSEKPSVPATAPLGTADPFGFSQMMGLWMDLLPQPEAERRSTVAPMPKREPEAAANAPMWPWLEWWK
jgi:hypothetical protein